jgi:hypothetical protein
MRLFWRKSRGPGDKHARDAHPSSMVASHLSRPSTDVNVTGFLDDDDWDRINDLLSCDERRCGSSYSESCNDGVTSSLAGLRRSIGQQILPSGPVLDRLLDVWEAVHRVQPLAAKPVEALLSSLVARDLVSAKEITDMCDEVEAGLEPQRDRADIEARPGRAQEGAHPHVAHPGPSTTIGTSTCSGDGT